MRKVWQGHMDAAFMSDYGVLPAAAYHMDAGLRLVRVEEYHGESVLRVVTRRVWFPPMLFICVGNIPYVAGLLVNAYEPPFGTDRMLHPLPLPNTSRYGYTCLGTELDFLNHPTLIEHFFAAPFTGDDMHHEIAPGISTISQWASHSARPGFSFGLPIGEWGHAWSLRGRAVPDPLFRMGQRVHYRQSCGRDTAGEGAVSRIEYSPSSGIYYRIERAGNQPVIAYEQDVEPAP